MASNAKEKNTSLTQSIPLQPKYVSNFSFDRLLCNRLIQSHFNYKSNIFPLLNRNFKNYKSSKQMYLLLPGMASEISY